MRLMIDITCPEELKGVWHNPRDDIQVCNILKGMRITSKKYNLNQSDIIDALKLH